MLKREMYKILKRRSVVTMLAFLFIFMICISISIYFNDYYFNLYDTEQGLLSGSEGKVYHVKAFRNLKGILDDDLVARVFSEYDTEDFIFSEEKDMVCRFFGVYFIENGTNRVITVKEAFPHIDFDLTFGLYTNWSDFEWNWENISQLFPIFIIIAFGPLFSYEKQSGMEGILLTTKNGRKVCTRAKILSGFLLTNVSWLVLFAFQFLIFFICYGMEGYDTSIQIAVNGNMVRCSWEMIHLEFIFHTFLLGFLCINSILCIVMIVSFKSRSPFVSVCAALGILYAARFDMVYTLISDGLLSQIITLTPINVLGIGNLISVDTVNIGNHTIPWIYVAEVLYTIVLIFGLVLCIGMVHKNQKYYID